MKNVSPKEFQLYMKYMNEFALAIDNGIPDDEESFCIEEINNLINSKIQPYELMVYHRRVQI